MENLDTHSLEENLKMVVLNIASRSYQVQTWLNINKAAWECYAEDICTFYEVTEIILGNKNHFSYSEKQINLLKHLYEMVDNYDEPGQGTDEEIVNDPEWDKIRQFAKKVYDTL